MTDKPGERLVLGHPWTKHPHADCCAYDCGALEAAHYAPAGTPENPFIHSEQPFTRLAPAEAAPAKRKVAPGWTPPSVGCEDGEGVLHVHLENTTCVVCAPAERQASGLTLTKAAEFELSEPEITDERIACGALPTGLPPCKLGHAPQEYSGSEGHWVSCVQAGCWIGPVCSTPALASAAWRQVMG